MTAGIAEEIEGANSRCLIVCEHASNRVPEGFVLRLPAAVMRTHIAIDIGAANLSRALAGLLGCGAHLATVSRLVVDLNRPADVPSLIPQVSDGVAVPGNIGLDDAEIGRRRELHRAFHARLEARIAAHPPALLISVHSFTPSLASEPSHRPWPIAVLWNKDDRAAIPGLEALRRHADPVGANQPYSGIELNYTMDRHGEATGIPYLGLEVRQDMIADATGVDHWAAVVADAVRHVLDALQ